VAANWLAYNTPILFTAHGLLYEGFNKLRRRYRFFSRFFSRLTAVSEAVADRHKVYLNWPSHVSVIRNGVPAIQRKKQLRYAVRAELGIKPDTLLFLAVGNPRPEKGFEYLIDATAILRDTEGRNQDFVVAIAGKLIDSEYCRMLHRRMEEKSVQDRFQFLGFRDDTTALYSAADVFVLSSLSEGLPMVILESMMAGLPVVATSIGGVPDVVGNNGLLVEAANPKQLAVAMNRMINKDGLTNSIGRTGREHVLSTYGVDRMVDDYIACYETMISRRASA